MDAEPGAAELLAKLVSFDTTSRNSNLPLIDYVRSLLDGWGVPYRLSHDGTGTKANLHAVVGPQAAGGLALSGHVDTVPVDGQRWASDPFALRRDNGRLHARGAADMKGFVACCLAAVPDLLRANLSRPVHLFLSYDEEVSCDGARRLIEDLEESGLRPALCVVGEPSGMRPILAHKGRLAARVTLRGRAGHSSTPARGANAVFAAAEAINWVAAEARRFAEQGPFAEGFDPPHTTAHVGTVQGGTILNIIPEHAEFVMEWRTVPADDFFHELDRLRTFLAARADAVGFEAEVLNWIPGMSLPPDHALTAAVHAATGSNAAGKVSYGTEGGLYQAAGIPTIVCGPGDIAQAHGPDEWIAESQLARCDAVIRDLARRLAA